MNTRDFGILDTAIVLALIALMLVGFSAIGAFLFGVAWNYVVPAVFHGPRITFLQGFAIIFLISTTKSVFGFATAKP